MTYSAAKMQDQVRILVVKDFCIMQLMGLTRILETSFISNRMASF